MSTAAMATPVMRREVARRGSRRSAPGTPSPRRGAAIPATGQMEVLSPEPVTEAVRRPRSSGLRAQQAKATGPRIDQDDIEDSHIMRKDAVASDEEPKRSNFLGAQQSKADSLRAELESYMDHVREVADLGQDFEEKVSFALQSDQAAQELAEQSEMDSKVAAGKKKIAKLEEKLLALEKRAAEVAARSTPSSARQDREDLFMMTDASQGEHDQPKQLALPPLPGTARDVSKKPRKRRRRRARRHSDGSSRDEGMDDDDGGASELDSLAGSNDVEDDREEGKLASDFVERNIQLAHSQSRLMTPQDEARVQELLRLVDFEENESGVEPPEEDAEEKATTALTGYGESPETAEQDAAADIENRLRLLVGPAEWETKSAYLADDVSEADDCKSTVRSVSGLSRATESKREAKQRLQEIDEALQHAALMTNSDGDVQCELHVLLTDARKSMEEHGMATRDDINALLCSLGMRSPTAAAAEEAGVFALTNAPSTEFDSS